MQLASWILRRRSPAPAIECKQVTRVAHLISLRGELGPEDGERVESRLAAIVDRGGVEIVVDLAAARSVDRAVVAVLLRTANELRQIDGELLLAARGERRDGYVLKVVGPDSPDDLRGLHPALTGALEALCEQGPVARDVTAFASGE